MRFCLHPDDKHDSTGLFTTGGDNLVNKRITSGRGYPTGLWQKKIKNN